jgi:hypothetical protein
MCWRKKPKPEVLPDFTDNTIVHIAVGDFAGTVNDLAGPQYDQQDFEKRVLKDWPHYTFRKYKDSKGTAEAFTSNVKSIVARMKPEDTLFFIMDVCHAGTNTRSIKTTKMVWPSEGMNHIAMSAARPFETAADAVLNGRPNGAYHYCLLKTLEKGITYREWDARAQALLLKLGFTHVCTIEGPDRLLDRLVFEGTTYAVIVSSHGMRRPDRNGDEDDGYDECVVFYDKDICDDEIAEMLKNIPIN